MLLLLMPVFIYDIHPASANDHILVRSQIRYLFLKALWIADVIAVHSRDELAFAELDTEVE
jgi:hypothetical protein